MLLIATTFSYLLFVFVFIWKGGYFHSLWSPVGFVLTVIYGLVSVNLIPTILETLLRKRNRIRRVLGLLFLTVFLLLYIYKLDRKFSIDLNLILSNLSIAANIESLSVIVDVFSFKRIAIILFIILAYLGLEVYREKSHKRLIILNRKYDKKIKTTKIISASAVVLFGLFSILPFPTMDEVLALSHGFSKYLIDSITLSKGESSTSISKDYILTDNKPFLSDIHPYSELPDIIVLMIESFSGTFLENGNSDGTAVMPHLMNLSEEGLYIENYYGNSVQTAKGQYAALFSQIPSYMQKVFVGYENNSFKSIAEILNETGYSTAFIKAYKDINFDNSGHFLLKNGFSHAFSLYDFLSEEEKENIWGWGPEDLILYRHIPDFFKYIKSREKSEKPVFMVLHTVMNHMYFDQIPEEKRLVYKNPKKRYENYTNSIKLVDEQLPEFKRVLMEMGLWDNSIIVITGDHGFPVGEHTLLHNELSFYEETLRTPMLMIAKEHIPSFRQRNIRYSHIDLGPTILDLIGISEVSNTFVGDSMLRENDKNRPVYCIQPYSGGYLISIRGDYKYLYHRGTNNSFFYDLAEDPMEQNPKSSKMLSEDLSDLFKSDINYIIERQMALEQDRLFPDIQ